MTEIEGLERWRADTHGASGVAHLNNCGAALPPASVVEAVVEHIRLEERIGPYEAAAVNAEAAAALYGAVAETIGCEASEVAFCDSATRAWNTFVYSLRLRPGDLIVTSRIEFGSGLIALQHIAERSGAEIAIAPCDDEGRILPDQLGQLLDRLPKLVALTHVAAHSGTVNPVAEIGALVKRTGSLYLVDCCQSLGQMRINVDEIGCDALTGTGRKWLRAPRGTGFLYVRDNVAKTIDPATSDLVTADFLLDVAEVGKSRLKFREDSRRFEVWERSIAGAIGLGKALQYFQFVGADTAHNRIVRLAQRVRDGLADVEGAEIWAPAKVESGVVGLRLARAEPSEIKELCGLAGINISTMADWDAPLDFAARRASSVARIAPHYYNTEQEIDSLLRCLKEATN